MASTADDFREFAEYVGDAEICRLFPDPSDDISTYIGIFEPASISNGELLIIPSVIFKDQSLLETPNNEAEFSPKEQIADPPNDGGADNEKEIISGSAHLVSRPGEVTEDWQNFNEQFIFNDENHEIITKPTTHQVQSGVSLFSHSDRTRVSKCLRTTKTLLRPP